MARNEAATLTIDLNLKGAGINRQIRDITKRMRTAFGKIETGGGGGGRGGQGVGGPGNRAQGAGAMLWNMFPVAYAASTAATLGNPMQSLSEKVANFPLVSSLLPLISGGRGVLEEAGAAGRTRGRVGGVVEMLAEGGNVSDEAINRMIAADKPLAERQAAARQRVDILTSAAYEEDGGGAVVEMLIEIAREIRDGNTIMGRALGIGMSVAGAGPLVDSARAQRANSGE